MDRTARRQLVALVVVTVWVATTWALQFALEGTIAADVAANLVEAASPAAAWFVCRRAGRRTGVAAWRWIGAACACWTVGSLVWTWYVAVARDSVPFPSVADAGYMAFFVPAIIGAVLLHERPPRGADLVRHLLDALLVAASLTVVLWFAILGAAHRGDGMLRSGLSVGYVVGDIAVVSLVVSAVRANRQGRRELYALLAGLALLTAGDALFSYQEATDTYTSAWFPDLGWIGGFSLIALGAFLAASPRSAPAAVRRRGDDSIRSLLLFGPYLAAVSVAIVGLVRNGRLEEAQGWTTIALATIAFARQVVAQAERSALTRHLERQVVELTESQTRFRASFDHAPIGMVVIDADGTISRVNAAFSEMVVAGPDDLLGTRFVDLAHPNDREVLERVAAAGRTSSDVVRLEARLTRAGDLTIWTVLSAVGITAVDQPRYVIAQIEDVTERREISRALEHNARHDPLTGLANRALFTQTLTEAIADGSARRGFAVAFVDLDRFKFVNDSLGHEAGDRLLCIIAERLRATSRTHDLVARFGGDEFTLLLRDVPDTRTALAIAERIEVSLREPMTLNGVETFITASVGIAVSRPLANGVDPEEAAEHLLRNADTAMYRAKEAGRSRTEVFDEHRDRVAPDRLEIANALHRALERDEFRVFYQPVVDVADGQVVGFEALLRWERTPGSFVAPSEFIHVAEDTGLIVPIGAWVLRTACRQAAQWHALAPDDGRRPLTVSVNLSPRQFDSGDLLRTVSRAIAVSGLPADSLWLEITESALMRDTTSTISVLRDLRELGVHLSVDDFGTGYSSLSYLKRFPVEALKIDRSFTDGLGTDPEDSAIVTAVVGLAHALHIAAVAEGVETEAQLAHLRRLGCDGAQGFLFGRPTPAEALGDRPSRTVTRRSGVIHN